MAKRHRCRIQVTEKEGSKKGDIPVLAVNTTVVVVDKVPVGGEEKQEQANNNKIEDKTEEEKEVEEEEEEMIAEEQFLLCDVYAFFCAVFPLHITKQRQVRVYVELAGFHSRGQVICDWSEHYQRNVVPLPQPLLLQWQNQQPVNVVLGLNREAFVALWEGMLGT